MGTRSRIGLDQRPNNYPQPNDSNPWTSNLLSMYCHYDGYVEYTGKMLLEHYDSKKRVKELIMLTLGYASALYETPEVTRERSVDHEDLRSYQSVDEVIAEHENSDIEYIYLFQEDEWYFSERRCVKCANRYQGSFYYYWTNFQKLADHPEFQKTETEVA